MIYNKKTAFTLVELIVVITILSILATIAFVSFTGYSTSARESARLNDVKTIEKKLSFYQVKNNRYPLPDNYVTLTASGNTVGYQGEVGTGVLVTLEQAGDIVDPLDGERYSYYVLSDQNNFQILTLMEEQGSLRSSVITQTYAANSDRYAMTFGKKLGILTDATNTPIQETLAGSSLDLAQTSTGYIAYLTDTESVSGTGSDLRQTIPKTSCKRLYDLESGGDGNYTIYPIDENPTEVYCNMTDKGGGLTLIARSVDDIAFNGADFGWFVQTGSISNNARPYSLGSTIQDIPFEKIYFGVHNGEKTFSGGITELEVTDIDLFNGSYTNTAKAVDSCTGVPITIQYDHDSNPGTPRVPVTLSSSCLAFGYWGKFGSSESYFLSNNPAATADGLNRRRYGASFPYEGLIFVK